MAILDEIARITQAKEDFKTKLIEKGVEVTDDELISDYPPKLDLIKGSATVTRLGGWVGTPVPYGYVDYIYGNFNLSTEEVIDIVSKITPNIKDQSAYHLYGIWSLLAYLKDSSNYGLYIEFNPDDYSKFSIVLRETTTEYVLFTTEDIYDTKGWTVIVTGGHAPNPSEIKTTGTNENGIGNQNDKLSSLFSTIPFVKIGGKQITLEGDYDGSTLILNELPNEVNESTPVNGEPIDTIYFNTDIDISYINNVLQNLTYTRHEGAANYSQCTVLKGTHKNDTSEKNQLIAFKTDSGVYMMIAAIDINMYEIYSSTTGFVKESFDINISSFDEYEVAQTMFKGIISSTPIKYFPKGTISVQDYLEQKKLPLAIKLDLKQDGFPIEVNSLPKSDWIGTTVPNSGMVDNIYFNTNLSVNDVVDVLSKLNYTNNTYFVAHSGSKIIEISNEETLYVIKVDNIIVFCNMAEPSIGLNRGWSDTLQNPYQFNSEAKSVAGIYEVGTQNDLLSSLFSTTPFIEDNPAEEESIYKIKGGYDIYLQMETLKEMASAYGISLPCTFGQYMDALITAMGGGEGSFDYEVIVVTKDNYNEFISNPKMSVIDNESLSMFFTIYALIDEDARNQYAGYTFISFAQEDNEIQWLPVVHEFVAGMMGLEYENDTVMFKGIMSDPKEITEDGYYIIGSEQSQYYLCEDNAFKELVPEDKFPKITIKGDWKGTTVPNSGYVEKVYLNGSVEDQKETLWNIITSLPYQTALGRKCYPVFIREDLQQCLLIEDVDSSGVLYELRLLEGTNETSYLAITTDEIQSLGDVIINVNANVVESYSAYGITNVGSDNDKLSTLISITPIVQDIVEQVKPKGEYDGSTLVLNELPKDGWNGTAVPSGTINEVYFNTKLSIEEVTNILDNASLEYDSTFNAYEVATGLWVGKSSNDNTYIIMYVDHTDGSMDLTKTTYIFVGSEQNMGFVGWNPNITSLKYTYDSNEGTPSNTSRGKNELIKDVISITPFVQSKANTIDVKALIEQKKIPLAIEVNVSSGGGEGEIRSLKALLDTTKRAYELFRGAYELVDASTLLDYNDTSNVTSIQRMFYDCKLMEILPLFDTSNVTYMDEAFSGCFVLPSIPLLNTSKVTSMKSTFKYCRKLTEIPLLDTSKVTNMNDIFNSCNALEKVPLLDMSSCTNIGGMFYYCWALKTVTFKDTSNVTYFNSLFNSCTVLESVYNLDLLNATNVGSMFYDCLHIKYLDIKNIRINFQLVINQSYTLTLENWLNIFRECINTGSARTLTIQTNNLAVIEGVYVKLTNEPEVDSTLPKLPMVQCESTDEGAMLVADYMALKQWSLA